MRKSLFLILIILPLIVFGQSESFIEIGTFNIEWFPCKDDGAMMKKYGIELRYPPQGQSTDIAALFSMLKELDIELLGVNEIVDPQLFEKSAKEYLGDRYNFIYSDSGGSQKVGFLYDSDVFKLVGQPQTYGDITLGPDSRLRPAYRAYFKGIENGFDFHAIVVHLKASPRGWDLRKKQWQILENILHDLPEDTQDRDIILLGDFNNVSKKRFDEFKPVIKKLNFYWATEALDNRWSSYWTPDYKVERIEASLIDQIFISADAKIEYVEGSTAVGGMCASGQFEFRGDSIPEYYDTISDHCPVYGSFRVDVDND